MHNTRSASQGLGNDSSKSVPAIVRKKDTIDNFKSKLNRLEKNKQDLENKMKLFDAKVTGNTAVTNDGTDNANTQDDADTTEWLFIENGTKTTYNNYY